MPCPASLRRKKILSEGAGSVWWKKNGMKKENGQSRNVEDVPVVSSGSLVSRKNREAAFGTSPEKIRDEKIETVPASSCRRAWTSK